MSTQLKIRGGTTTEHSSFTGAEREITVDTTLDTLVVHDGVTAGGIPLAKLSDVSSPPGAINASNISTSGTITSTGSITTSADLISINLIASNNISASNNITASNSISGNNITATNSISGSTITASNNITSTSDITAYGEVNTPTVDLGGGFKVTQSGGKLIFTYNGSNVFSVTSGGNMTASGNVTAFGSP